MAPASPDHDGTPSSALDDERHPVFDTWATFGVNEATAASTDDTEGSEPFETSSSFTEPLGPINWNTLDADEAASEWLDLNAWVNWLRGTYGLSPSVLPPMWHRHDELVWELSALHLHWLNCYAADASPSSPLGWHRDFTESLHRLRDWVAACGTRLDRDRPTRQTKWPGEPAFEAGSEVEVTDRAADFAQFVADDVAARRQIEAQVARRAS